MRSRSFACGVFYIGFITWQVFFQSAATAAQPSFQGLGDLPGDAFYSISYAVSGDGSTAVGYSHAQNSDNAFRWRNGAMTNLGSIDGNRGSSSYGYAASSNGAVVVGVCGVYNVGFEAFRWENGTMAGLGKISGADWSFAHGVSANGAAVAGYNIWYSTSRSEAFRWENGTMVGLGGLYSGNIWSEAYGISADGSVVIGESKVASGRYEAFRWEDGVMTSLGVLTAGSSSTAYGISANESVIVGGAGAGGAEHAFRWVNGVMSDLGNIPGGYYGSTAYDVSADGSIVVGYSRKDPVYSAMIWDQKHGMRDLKSVLVNDYKLNLTGWTLKYAEGISDDGRTIVGYGVNPQGLTEGWIATIPEPASAAIMILGASLIASRRKR